MEGKCGQLSIQAQSLVDSIESETDASFSVGIGVSVETICETLTTRFPAQSSRGKVVV